MADIATILGLVMQNAAGFEAAAEIATQKERAPFDLAICLSVIAILISFGSLFLVFKETIHKKRQRRLLVTFELSETFTGWGDDLDTVVMKLTVTAENRSYEDCVFSRLIFDDLPHKSLGTVEKREGFEKLRTRTDTDLKLSAPAKSTRQFDFFATFSRDADGGMVQPRCFAEFRLSSPLQGLDFFNLSKRRWYRCSDSFKYATNNAVKTEMANAR